MFSETGRVTNANKGHSGNTRSARTAIETASPGITEKIDQTFELGLNMSSIIELRQKEETKVGNLWHQMLI